MNTKRIPALVMLLAGSVAVIVMTINHYSFEEMLVRLILILIGFLILGIMIKLIFDSFHIEEPDEDRVDDEGEVVEKTEFADGDEEKPSDEDAVPPEEESTGQDEINA